MKSGPLSMVLMCSIDETRFIKEQSEMFEMDLQQKSNETTPFKYGLDL